MSKVVIVGVGNVGMAYAYAIVSAKLNLDELVLIDIDKTKAEGEAIDLTHAVSCTGKNLKVRAGDYSDCSDASIVCISAGKSQNVGETRTDLIHKNYDVFKSIITEINKTSFDGIYLIATNPLDVMTYITFKLSKFAPNRVIGSGTTLDTARLRALISEKLDINTKNIHAYVIGEHGDSEFVCWSNAMIGLNKATNYIPDSERDQMEQLVKNSAYEIIRKKGNTAYGIGMCLLNITKAILENCDSIFTVSAYNDKLDMYYGMPTILNREGARETLELELDEKEKVCLEKSISDIKTNILSLQGK